MRASLVLALLLGAGCSMARYIYQPAVQADAQADGMPAANFQIPQGHPTGDVRIASFGVTKVAAQDGGPKMKAIHVRMVITNNQDEAAWSLDAREISVVLPNAATSRPAFINTDLGAPPMLKIARGQKATVDLYYPLPPAMESAKKLPSFDVVWEVKTGAGEVAQRTPFERLALYPYYYYPYGYSPYAFGGPYGFGAYPGFGFSVGLGPYWWYDPWYPSYGFHGAYGLYGPGVVYGPGYRTGVGVHVEQGHQGGQPRNDAKSGTGGSGQHESSGAGQNGHGH